MKRSLAYPPDLFPFAISTSKGHYVILQCLNETDARKRYATEESYRGNITSISKVE